jgi:D-glycero-D-manno-heptose 1,7-bisphosphate phosphatase
MTSRMTRLILLDRDGVVNFDSPQYVKDADEWLPIPGSLEAIARLKRAGLLVAVCTNQSGIGRGILTDAALARIHGKFAARLAELGVTLDALVYCPHHPDDGCLCRKPRAGMLTEVMARLQVSPAETLCVGDSMRDLEAARAAGCRAALVMTGKGASARAAAAALGVDCVADDLAALARAILRRHKNTDG